MSSISKIIFYKRIETLGPLDGTLELSVPLLFRRKCYLKIEKITLSKLLPNIFSWNTFTNRTIRISKDGITYQDLIFDPGVYTVDAIQAVVYSFQVNNGYNPISVSSAPIRFDVNPFTQRLTIRLDSSQSTTPAALPNLSIILNPYTSRFNELVGFTSATTITGDGIYTSDVAPPIDWQGVSINVGCSISDTIIYNGIPTNFIANLSLSEQQGSSVLFYPEQGHSNKAFPLNISDTLRNMSFDFRSPSRSDSNNPVVFMGGSDATVVMSIIQI